MFARRKMRIIAVCVGLICIAVALRIWYIRSHSMKAGEWFIKWSDHIDETFKSNGLVKVGSNTWELPRDSGTNTPSVSMTNTVGKH
jgi:4-amino-4-deoxy-L-arabinose transferase-like glycosyltransferase